MVVKKDVWDKSLVSWNLVKTNKHRAHSNLWNSPTPTAWYHQIKTSNKRDKKSQHGSLISIHWTFTFIPSVQTHETKVKTDGTHNINFIIIIKKNKRKKKRMHKDKFWVVSGSHDWTKPTFTYILCVNVSGFHWMVVSKGFWIPCLITSKGMEFWKALPSSNACYLMEHIKFLFEPWMQWSYRPSIICHSSCELNGISMLHRSIMIPCK